MRLLDQIVRSPREVIATDPFGRKHRMTGVGAKADLLDACSLRYILDRQVSQQCFALVRSDTGLLDPESELLRLPAQCFWLEWSGEEEKGVVGDRKLGALVEADEGGRSGFVTGFWQNDNGQADLTVVATEFDLDRPLNVPVGSHTAIKVRHGTLPHVNRVFEHVLFHLDPSWEPYLRARHRDRFRASIHELAEAVWFNLPQILAFTAMLNSKGVLEERSTDLARLNRARTSRGKRALLDHIEVRMNVGDARQALQRSGGTSRATPRLHHVRGHFVQRAGKTFWRSSHLRGDHDRPIATKTVTVTGWSGHVPRSGQHIEISIREGRA